MALRIRCRQIGSADIDGVVNLLTSGFRTRSRGFWVRVFRRLSEHATAPGFPKYGYLLEAEGVPVGVVLLIFSSIAVNGDQQIRCSMSSWYVEPAYRVYGAVLVSHAMKHEPVTYFNITPLPHTLPILEAQRFTRYCDGRFVAIPALSPGSHCVAIVKPGIGVSGGLPQVEIDLLLAHETYGSISIVCRSTDGLHPFVFLPLQKAGVLQYAYLAYCRDLEEFVRFAGPVGRFLVQRGLPAVVVDANGPIHGLIGRYSGGFPKYFKGPDKPSLGDLAYTERVMFRF
jgi:hypothetical protein